MEKIFFIWYNFYMSGLLAGGLSGLIMLGLLALNFGISWCNAKNVGKIWSESKQIGGGTRVLAVVGYAMAVVGFTMVYVTILIALIAVIGPMTGYLSSDDTQYLLSLISNMSYILTATAIIPLGIIAWINSLIRFWKNKSLRTGGIAAWNTFANVRNVINASRNMPSAISRLTSSLKKSDGKGGLVILAIIVVLCAILGGYFTASAIVKSADRKYDLFVDVQGPQGFAPQQ